MQSKRAVWKQRFYLESSVLENFFDGSIIAAANDLCLEDHTERAIADHLAVCVRELKGLS